MIDLNDFYSGGYFLLRANKPDWPRLETIQHKLISLSSCICPKVHPFLSRDSALEVGISEDKFDTFDPLCWQFMEGDGMFATLEVAQAFIQEFMLPQLSDLYLLEVGLPKELESQFTNEEVTGKERIQQHLPLKAGGTILGFEIISHFGRFSHSWWCSGVYLDDMFHRMFDIQTNQHGLLATYDDAKAIYEWNGEGYQGEPEPYHFWLLISHPLSTPTQ